MSYHDIVHVQKTLKVLCNVFKEAFLPHRTETLLVFQKLWTVVRNDDDTWTSSLTNNHSSCSSSSKDHSFSSALMITNKSSLPALAAQSSSTSSLNGSNSFFTLSNIIDTFSLALHSQSSTTFSIQQFFSSLFLSDHELSSTSSVLILTQALNKDSTQIQKFLSRSELEAIENELEWIVENSHVVDLQLDESWSTSKIRFQKSLSQRFLAIEFIQWKRHTYESSKVSVLMKNLSISQERGLKHIVKYLESNNRRFKKQNITRREIKHEIKFLVFELLVDTRVISAILSFKYSLFRAIKFEDLLFLKTMMNDSKWIKKLVKQKIDWYDECQTLYDDTWSLLTLTLLIFLQCDARSCRESTNHMSLAFLSLNHEKSVVD